MREHISRGESWSKGSKHARWMDRELRGAMGTFQTTMHRACNPRVNTVIEVLINSPPSCFRGPET